MKKLIAGLVLGSVLLVNTAFAANTDNVNEKVAAAFKHEFVQAKEVSWSKSDNGYRAIFRMNEDILTAFFSEDGILMGVTRNLLSTELPIGLQTSLHKSYDGYWISGLFEYSKQDDSGYLVTLENADEVITLQATDGRNWSVYRKTKKQ
jgi:hypothetical protein